MFRSVPPVLWFFKMLFWLARPKLLIARLRDADALYRSRLELAALGESQRRDIGVTEDEVRREAAAPVFGAPSPWASDRLHDACRQAEAGASGARSYERSFYQTRGRTDLGV